MILWPKHKNKKNKEHSSRIFFFIDKCNMLQINIQYTQVVYMNKRKVQKNTKNGLLAGITEKKTPFPLVSNPANKIS